MGAENEGSRASVLGKVVSASRRIGDRGFADDVQNAAHSRPSDHRQTGTAPNFSDMLEGKPFDLSQTAEVVKVIESGIFDGRAPVPRDSLRAAETLSLERVTAVKKTLLVYPRSKRATLVESHPSDRSQP